MPTVDSPAETAGRTEPKPGDKVPLWAKLQHELRELGLQHRAGARDRDRTGRLLPETRDVLATIARHGLILATAHLGRDDTFAVVDAALRGGGRARRRHAPGVHRARSFSIEDQVALAERGCLIERCLTHAATAARRRGSTSSTASARSASSATFFSSDCGNPDYPPVEDGLALWADRLLDAGFDEDEVREMIVDELAAAGGRRMSRRLLVIGAHSADFVWRAGGAIAVTTAGRRHRARARALLRRAGRVRRALEGAGHDRRAREGDPPRRGRAGGGRARRRVRVPRPRRLPARDRRGRARRRSPTGSATFAPDVLVTHTDRDPFNPDHAVAFFAVERARALAAGAGVASAFETVQPPELLLFEPHQPELCNFTPTTFVDITPVIEQKRAAMAEMKAQAYLQTYYDAARRAARQPRAPLLRQLGDPVRRGVPARDAAGGGRAVSDVFAELARLGTATVHEAAGALAGRRRAADPDRARLARRRPGAHRALRPGRQPDGARRDRRGRSPARCSC